MTNAQKPTRRTRHVEVKHMIILQWCDDEFLSFIETKSESNYSDSLSKPTKRRKFNQHCDIFMGRRKPAYATILSIVPNDDTLSTNTHIVHFLSFSSCKNPTKNIIINKLINNPIYYMTNELQSSDSSNCGRVRAYTCSTRDTRD